MSTGSHDLAGSAGSPGPTVSELAFIGTGTMGNPMAHQVVNAGHRLRVHDLAPSAVTSLVEAGATACATAADAANGARIVLLSLPGPGEVRDAVVGVHGILSAPRRPAMIVDLSTNSVEVGRELRARCDEVGVAFVDAPVSGGVAKARTGSLAVMVGAELDEFRVAREVLDVIGDDIFHVGPPGSGTIAKIVNNQLFLAAGVLVQEAYVLAASLGVTPADLHAIVSASSAGPYTKLAPLLLGRRFDDVIFRLDIAAKDVALAVHTAETAGVDVPLTRAAEAVYRAAVDHGDATLVFHATLRELERRAGIELEPLRRPSTGSGDRRGGPA
jgi:3-hydroxyisobutyrate dehydrogenase-like beta-hydroxyacid dehydrogenase